jgi:hypothetical protein
MKITYIAKNGQNLGGFDEAGITEGLRTGYFSHDDAAWREGMTEWVRLEELFNQPEPPALPESKAVLETTLVATEPVARMATEKQIAYIRVLGGEPSPGMTITEASAMIGHLKDDPEAQERRFQKQLADDAEQDKNRSYFLHRDVENIFTELTETRDPHRIDELNRDLKDSSKMRVQYWQDVFGEDAFEGDESATLFEEYGQHFKRPTQTQITMVLGELDTELGKEWERTSATSFFPTLEKKYPQLKKVR